MDKYQILEIVQEIVRDVIDEENITITEQSTANDVNGWDSLTNVEIIVSIERKFDIRFTSEEMIDWKNIGEMIESINNHLTDE